MWILLSAMAVEPETCPPANELVAAERWLRAASLDIRGVVPSPEDYQQVTDPDALPDALLDSWLESDGFVERAVRDHQKRLWNRLPDNDLISNRRRLGTTSDILWARQKSTVYRGAPNVHCGDFPAEDADGDGTWDVDADGREGWVEVAPFWDPDTSVRVCAFDAQDVPVSDSGIACDTLAGDNDAGCGCGPSLNWCITRAHEQTMRDAMGAAMDHRIAEVIRSHRTYTDLFFEDVTYVNGPLVHLYRHLGQLQRGIRLDFPQLQPENLPDLSFDDVDTWVALPAPAQAAGIFTDPVFLTRFMTNRARVNRFYEDFLCQPLTAPAAGISVDGPETPDLANRAGCAYCHALIEPAGLYWGRFVEGGPSFLPPDDYPAFDQACYDCSTDNTTLCPDYCDDFYIVNPSDSRYDPYIGTLIALQFRPEDEVARIDAGPSALVEAQIANGRMPECLTRKTATWLLGREPLPTDDDAIQDWNGTLLASDWDYRALVKAIVTSESYRRVQ